ncbi:hypothetical protein EJB05_17586 [Eragrostis curvula]|uniref:Uncharacterized protein n=1 Tax=Eragrostis curvula TaxID=38414 RepID=A0A5J9VJI0_9POAL|nr:hypothetical protein EJB05_17586 [Eragrostis curvula]
MLLDHQPGNVPKTLEHYICLPFCRLSFVSRVTLEMAQIWQLLVFSSSAGNDTEEAAVARARQSSCNFVLKIDNPNVDITQASTTAKELRAGQKGEKRIPPQSRDNTNPYMASTYFFMYVVVVMVVTYIVNG